MNSRAEEKREFFDLEERILPEEALFFGKRLARFWAVAETGRLYPEPCCWLWQREFRQGAGSSGTSGTASRASGGTASGAPGQDLGYLRIGKGSCRRSPPGDCPFPPGNGGS